MDEQKKPRSRVKKVVNDGKGVEVHGEGLGTGPLNNTGNYADRKQQTTACDTEYRYGSRACCGCVSDLYQKTDNKKADPSDVYSGISFKACLYCVDQH